MNLTIPYSKPRFSGALGFLGLAALASGVALSGCAFDSSSDEEAGEIDENAAEPIGSAASSLAVGMHDVGIIPCAPKACPAGSEYVEIHTDDEDNNNASNTSGWTGAISRDPSGTTFGFCRVDGLDFHPATVAYAVLKLGASCPPGSYNESRHFDNENSSTHNWASGTYSPNVSSNDSLVYGAGDTTLKFCSFSAPAFFAGNDQFPYYVFPYGVFAASGGLAMGHVHTDDEDKNRFPADMQSGNDPIGGDENNIISAFIYSSDGQSRPNSELNIAQMAGGQCPTGLPTASSLINGSSSSPVPICPNSPITLDGSASTFATNVFVSVMKSNANWGSAGPEYMRWLTPSDLNDYGPMSHFNVRGFFSTFGQSFVVGEYYRIKLAVGSPWNETVKLVHIKPPTAAFTINGSNTEPIIVPMKKVLSLDASASACASSYFVSMMQTNANGSSSSQEYGRWLTPADFSAYGSINQFNLKGFVASFNQGFLAGNYYKVKLKVGNPVSETTRLVYAPN